MNLFILLFHWGNYWGIGKYSLIPDKPIDYVIVGMVVLLFIIFRYLNHKRK